MEYSENFFCSLCKQQKIREDNIMRQFETEEFRKILKGNGYYKTRFMKGSHENWKKDGSDKVITIKVNQRELNAAIANRLIRENKLVIK